MIPTYSGRADGIHSECVIWQRRSLPYPWDRSLKDRAIVRKLIMPVLAAMSLLTACYFALPFWTALELKRAIRNGDAAIVESRVEWDSVRTSLRQSLTEQAPNEARRRFSRLPFIQKYAERIAVSYSGPVVDKMVDNFGNADGLIRLMSWKEATFGAKPPKTLSGIASEMSNRVKRVAFVSLTRLETVIADRNDPKRHIFSAMELRDTGWKLTELRILPATE
jgi:Protein of unknown function (DUF2939)